MPYGRVKASDKFRGDPLGDVPAFVGGVLSIVDALPLPWLWDRFEISTEAAKKLKTPGVILIWARDRGRCWAFPEDYLRSLPAEACLSFGLYLRQSVDT